jgi:hypothetical protein
VFPRLRRNLEKDVEIILPCWHVVGVKGPVLIEPAHAREQSWVVVTND